MANETAISQGVIDALGRIEAAFKDGHKGIGQWIALGVKSPNFASADEKEPMQFAEAVLLKQKYDKSSADLMDRINVLQAAWRGVSQVAGDIKKAAELARDGAAGATAKADAAIASISSRIDDVLKLAKPPGTGSDLTTNQQL